MFLFYFIVLKSLMAGLAALFKIFFRISVDNSSSRKTENFQFRQHESLQITIKNRIPKDLEKYDIIGCFLLLFVYPVFIILISYTAV